MNNSQTLSAALSPNKIIILCALWMTLLGNFSYYQKVLEIYPISTSTSGFLGSIVVFQFGITLLLLSLFGIKFLLKPFLILMLISAASTAYFMDTFGIVIDQDMIRNITQTSTDEAFDLFSLKLLGYIFLLGLLPSIFVIKVSMQWKSLKHEIFLRLKLLVLSILIIVACLAVFYKPYASFFREHKQVRFYSNPVYMVYSSIKYASAMFHENTSQTLKKIGLDAHISVNDIERELVIFVVGETARWDHFSLNGYARKTNPLLEKENIYNFPQMTSCATSTALSVPCMFSYLAKDDFSPGEAGNQENALDVLTHANVNILWRDNNSSSKGVADRVQYVDFKNPENNPECDIECRDIGMLSGLKEYIDSVPEGDILIVLHQMGNHGPAYYKRYPKDFETFKPSCQTAQLEDCSNEEITNAYDNATLYTDFFLSQTIGFLKAYSDRFETAMMYTSDHGESLGESGVYLHGLPNFIAPESQTHVPAFLWLGKSYHGVDKARLKQTVSEPLSHDNLFHTLLGLFEVESDVHNPSMDILNHIEN